MKRSKRNTMAFTLVEMLIVTGMLAVLMGVAFSAVGQARRQAMKTKANAEVRELVNAWLAYEAAYDDWPVEVKGNDIDATEENLKELLGGSEDKTVYLNVNVDRGALRDPWGTPYRFRVLEQSDQNSISEEFEAAVTFPNRNSSL